MLGKQYNVYWDEVDEVTGLRETKRKLYFTSLCCAEAFRDSLKPEWNPRLFEAREETPEEWETVSRDTADVQNRRKLVELMRDYNITIPAKQFDKWRPTEVKTGRIDGVSDGLTCIMTDGMLGYFLREDKLPLYGHVEWFKWDVPEVSYIPYIDEHGQERFFKQVKDQGAPSAWAKRETKPRAPRERKPKVKTPRQPMTTQAALELIEQMTKQMNGGGSPQ
jgi:hypothetical protein